MFVKRESSPLEDEPDMKAATTESPRSSRDEQPFKTPPERLPPPAPILTTAPSATFAPPIPQTNMPTTAPKQAQAQDPYFVYKRNCRLAWIGYLGLLNKVKLREGPDGLPYFIGMPPEYSTTRISPDALERLQKEAMGDPRNSFICLQDVLTTLCNRPLHTHLGISVFLADRNHLKYWEAAGSRNVLALLNTESSVQGVPKDALTYQAILPAMNRLVGIRTMEEDPASFPSYVPAMASFERAIWNGQKAEDLTQRRQWGRMALRALRKFMDSQKNEVIIEKMMQFRRHYEALVAAEKQ
ncbi:hypothetical protein DER45DRAFT_634591 [Fusarium avenaceum]|nr:hypothetical protein DER45DRAFT_634591 [Fusarium avenaceum]